MEENCNVPPPINLNGWKHHASFITQQIKTVKKIETLDELKTHLLKIGESQMDLYFGKYSPAEISEQTLRALDRKKVFSSEQFQNWLGKEEKNYQLVKLKDKSLWTLRLGEDPERYVHIHPGRYSPHTMRVKATTLKTAIMILCFEQTGEIKLIETKVVNLIKKKYLSEPPIKSFSNASGLGRIIKLLVQKL
jgi:hypothetical protein